MKKILTQILAILVLTFTSFAVHSEENCEPEFELNKSVLNQAIAKDEEKGEVFVFFDQSTTMQGFTIDQPGQNNQYVNIVDDIQQVAENIGTDTIYQRFGSEINTMSDRDVAKTFLPSDSEITSNSKLIFILYSNIVPDELLLEIFLLFEASILNVKLLSAASILPNLFAKD